MLFNSYEFIFLFLPIVAFGFFAVGRFSRPAALGWLILASLFFYAWWRPINVLLIAPSILINFGLARALQRLLLRDRRRAAVAVLLLGIAFNLAFLGYFKYANFFVGAVNDAFGTHMILAHILLPLGISFITFQKIAFLIDVHSRRVDKFTLQQYCLFVLFFPQLIAGPIVHYREMMPQFERAPCAFDRENVAVGVTLFVFGLFKKAFLADAISPMVGTLYGNAAAGQPMTLFLAWMAAVGFTFQIYFDFSGYTDMALGAARLFGIRLPPNFNSPLRATSIIDFWLRWHMTLTRFLTAYLYNPLTLWLTRRRIAKGLKGFGGGNSSLSAFATLLVFPTILTMCVSGIWHGAGYLFIFWGFLHGVYLSINHGWRMFARKRWHDKVRYAQVMAPVGLALTFVSVVTAMVFFRAPSMHAATNIVKGMLGLHGVALPQSVFSHMGALALWLQSHGVGLTPADYFPFTPMTLWLAAMALVVFFMPNTLQIMARFEPALGTSAGSGAATGLGGRIRWVPSAAWAVLIAVAAVAGVLQLGGVSEFLYWQF